MSNDEIKAMLAAAVGANHVGEYPAGEYCPMPNTVGTVHAVSDLTEILELRQQRDQLLAAISSMSAIYPILVGHDQNKVIGHVSLTIEGLEINFKYGNEVTVEELFNIFGGAGAKIADSIIIDGVQRIRSAKIFEFSLCSEALPCAT